MRRELPERWARAAVAVLLCVSATGCNAWRDDEPATDEPGKQAVPGFTGTTFTPRQGRRVVLHEPFDRLRVGPGKLWGWQSGAYRHCHTNPDGFKLDRLSTGALDVRDGRLTITATPGARGYWRTGLLATGDACGSGGNGFEVRTGDVIKARVRLPTVRTGAWPAIWTWRDGRNEVDLFEWHSDRPDTLEFANHAGGSGKFWSHPAVDRGMWLDAAVRLGEKRVSWYVATPGQPLRRVHTDRKGVGPDFHAHLVVSLSADDGELHARPAPGLPFSFTVTGLTVYRPKTPPPLAPAPSGRPER
ncbi:hypothetical protein [Actinomadura flavalba]|uniref:hypothetical protein n=1 Tax=Actinomadura flavalba TaxID=1120938 RepID=UPI00037F31EC|nr:hypothetical protein [Actinomadura flavalba]